MYPISVRQGPSRGYRYDVGLSYTANLVKFGPVVFETREQTDKPNKHKDRQAYRHAVHNTIPPVNCKVIKPADC